MAAAAPSPLVWMVRSFTFILDRLSEAETYMLESSVFTFFVISIVSNTFY